VVIWHHSAPWDYIIQDEDSKEVRATSDDDTENILDSPQVNVLSKPPPNHKLLGKH
jgi:hypothetical protein